MKSIFYTVSVVGKRNFTLFFALMLMICSQAKSTPVNDLDKPGKKSKNIATKKSNLVPQRLATKKASLKNILACPCTLFSPSDVPLSTDQNDASPISLGVKFQADADGFITGIRFYKSAADLTGTHTGTLFDAVGTPLATATFTGETASGWQEVSFVTPVAITAATTYVASYYSSDGYYSFTNNTFLADVVVPPLTGLSEGGANGNNGLYDYDPGATGTVFPTSGNSATNYFVDAVYVQTIVLPVTLVNFKASAENNNIVLSWQTQTELNNLGFEVQRTTDGSTWTDVAFIKGAGESNTIINYSYIDKDLAPAHYSYRLKQINFDNNFQISKITAALVAGESKILLLHNFPNPFADNTTIQFVIPKAMKVKLTVLDLQGRMVKVLVNEMKQPGKYIVPFNAKGVSSGVYYYKLESDSQSPALVRKMVITR